MAFGFKRKKEDALDKQTDDLYNQIGRLKMENEWLKKVEMRFYEVMKVMSSTRKIAPWAPVATWKH